jgi:hypothetical protein
LPPRANAASFGAHSKGIGKGDSPSDQKITGTAD